MFLLLGAGGCVGHAFANELLRRGHGFIPLSRKALDYTNFNLLFEYIRKIRPDFLINASGFPGHPDEEACEFAREETLAANTLLPQTIARACLMTHTPWGHVSSGHIYSGAKIVQDGALRIERNLHRADIRNLVTQYPEQILGFNELDEPNFCFRCTPTTFYSGSKALAEEAVRDMGQSYIWRPGLTFNEQEDPRNFLWRIQRTTRLCDSVNSFSHIDDFVRACLALWEQRAPFGTYHVANPGALTTRQVVRLIQRILKSDQPFEFSNHDDDDIWETRMPHSHVVLDVSKLRRAGVAMRPVQEAVEDALNHWQVATRPVEPVFH
ncbi:MAG TPA: sugar nucleotide-binding protein [Verrucomicrobiae bacterium]|nr:sugar nucleotide-binding protein [Verrucomicrobiae bacterium]